MENLLQHLKLSKEEMTHIDVGELRRSETSTCQAIGKLLSERPAHPDALERALGRVWCPLNGTECKSLGENKFLFTFRQASGKKRALEERPWMFSNELLIMADLDESKAIEEIEFFYIPIWIRVLMIPIGLINKETGEAIGNSMGEFLEVEEDDGVVAVGKYLRVKIMLDVRKPLMRGVTMKVGKVGAKKWCPIVYEYLPDFCYTCGVIGHTFKGCSVKLGKGEKQPYDRGLRCIPTRAMGTGSNRGVPRLGFQELNSKEKHDGKNFVLPSRSNAPTWKKSVEPNAITNVVRGKDIVKKVMESTVVDLEKEGEKERANEVSFGEKEKQQEEDVIQATSQVNSAMQVEVDIGLNKEKERKFKRFRRMNKQAAGANDELGDLGKRSREAMLLDQEDEGVILKKVRIESEGVDASAAISTPYVKVGLSEQLRETQ